MLMLYHKAQFYFEGNYVGIVNDLQVSCAEKPFYCNKPIAVVSFLLTKSVFEDWFIIYSLHNKIQSFVKIKLKVKDRIYKLLYNKRIIPIPLIGNVENMMKIKLKTYEEKNFFESLNL